MAGVVRVQVERPRVRTVAREAKAAVADVTPRAVNREKLPARVAHRVAVVEVAAVPLVVYSVVPEVDVAVDPPDVLEVRMDR